MNIPASTLLPQAARDALAAAAKVDPKTPAGESELRTKALREAIERVRLAYPTYFQSEKSNG